MHDISKALQDIIDAKAAAYVVVTLAKRQNTDCLLAIDHWGTMATQYGEDHPIAVQAKGFAKELEVKAACTFKLALGMLSDTTDQYAEYKQRQQEGNDDAE